MNGISNVVEAHCHMIISNAVCVVIPKESEHHHSIKSPLNGAHPNPKTNRDRLWAVTAEIIFN